tara:strand:- start:4883 stop:5083 length:201 start_codon:yes stop_codon:yes gene_type:complete
VPKKRINRGSIETEWVLQIGDILKLQRKKIIQYKGNYSEFEDLGHKEINLISFVLFVVVEALRNLF